MRQLKPYLPILLIALIAIAYRFPLLNSLPPGLNFDEGGEGVAALDVLHGNFKIWWPIGGGKEPLMAYLVQPLFWIFGPTRLALRLYSALMGLGAVLATYFLAYQLSAVSGQLSAFSGQRSAFSGQRSAVSGQRSAVSGQLSAVSGQRSAVSGQRSAVSGQRSAFSGQRSAVSGQPSTVSGSPFTIHHSPFTILSALGLAIAFWHVAYSRIAFRALSNPAVEALALGFLWLALRSGKWKHFLAAGFFTGALIYTYLAGRFVPLALALFFIIESLFAWRARQTPLLLRYWRKLALLAGFAALTAAPLGAYFALHPEKFIERAGAVSIFSPQMNGGDFWGTLWRTTAATLGTFLSLTGDPNPLGNLPGKPELNFPLAILFVLGVGYALFRVFGFWFQVSGFGLESSNLKLETRNPKLETRNPKPETRNPKPETRNPKLETRNPKPLLFLLIWWPVMLLPAILAPEGAPHHLRLIGAAPGTYMFVALGAVLVSRWAGGQGSRGAGGQVGKWAGGQGSRWVGEQGSEKEDTRLHTGSLSHPHTRPPAHPHTRPPAHPPTGPPAHLPTRSPAHWMAAALLALIFGFTAWQTYADYFIRWNRDIDHYMDFDVYAEELAAQIAAEDDPRVTCVIPMDLRAAHEARHYSLDFLYQQKAAAALINHQTLAAVGGRRSAVITPYTYLPVDEAAIARQMTQAAKGYTALKVVRWTQDKHREADAKELVTYLLGTAGASFAGRKVYPAYITERYELPADETQFSLPAITTPISATLDGLLQVRRAMVQRQLTANRQVAIAVTYAPIAKMDVDYKASLRLIAPDGSVAAQKDRVLLHNWHQGTSQWPREEVNEYYLFSTPTDAIPGVYEVRLVVYHPDTLTPLTDNGRVEITLGEVEINPVPK